MSKLIKVHYPFAGVNNVGKTVMGETYYTIAVNPAAAIEKVNNHRTESFTSEELKKVIVEELEGEFIIDG